MAKLMQAIVAICKFLGLGQAEPARAVFDGWEGLHQSELEWRKTITSELKECAEDRKLLHAEIEECKTDRIRLNNRIDDLETKIT